jgi:hypothetical protein
MSAATCAAINVEEPGIAATCFDTRKGIRKDLTTENTESTERTKTLPERFFVFSALSVVSGSFQEFDAVAEGVAKLESIIAWDRNAVLQFAACCRELLTPEIEVLDQIRCVSFCFCPIDSVLSAEMYLTITKLKPKPAAAGQGIRLWDLLEPENAAVERAGFVLGFDGNTDLDVMK